MMSSDMPAKARDRCARLIAPAAASPAVLPIFWNSTATELDMAISECYISPSSTSTPDASPTIRPHARLRVEERRLNRKAAPSAVYHEDDDLRGDVAFRRKDEANKNSPEEVDEHTD